MFESWAGMVDVANLWVTLGDDVDVGPEILRRVIHHVEVPLDVRLEDSLEVVADTHVEDHSRGIAGESEPLVECVDQDPRTQVLVERLVDLELLRPLDVVPLVLEIDARFVDVEFVERLNRLQLDEPGPDEPRHDDVLGHLRVGPCRYPERSVQGLAVVGLAESVGVRGREECSAWDTEDRVVLIEFGEDPIRELFHRDGLEAV